MAIGGSSKGVVMTLFTLILFIMMLAELLTFVILSTSYNNIYQSLVTSSTSSSYKAEIAQSSGVFASASLGRALSALAIFEYNASLRGNDLIANTSKYLASLMVNGTVPGASPAAIAWLANSMGNMTLAAYNKSIISQFSTRAYSISITETKPLITQFNPYTLSTVYVEKVYMNTSSGIYNIPISVNATVPLNGTFDLFYAQQGVLRKIRFAGTQNLTSVIGNVKATSGGTTFVYGTVYEVPSGVTCTQLGSDVPTPLRSAPFNSLLIIATANAIGISNSSNQCVDSYGGLITYAVNSISAPPAVPWLVYGSSTNILQLLPTGRKVLIWGPTLSTLDIGNLRDSIANNSYFASPFAPSYLSRASGNFMTQSPNGIFTFVANDSEDSIFLAYNGVTPIPGVLSCLSSSMCGNVPKLYIGNFPLEPSSSPPGYLNESQVLKLH